MQQLISTTQSASYMAMKTDMTVSRIVRRLPTRGLSGWLRPYVTNIMSGGHADPDRLVDVLTLARSSANWQQRAVACWCLGKIPMSDGMQQRAREVLHQVMQLETGNEAGFVYAGCFPLHLFLLIHLLRIGNTNVCRESAAASLAMIGNSTSIEVLEKSVQPSRRLTKGEWSVRVASLRALHSILMARDERPITVLTDDATAGICRMLVPTDLGCQMMALDVLREFGTSRALSGLKRLLRKQMFSPMQSHVEEAISAVQARHNRLVMESQLLRPSFGDFDSSQLLRPSSFHADQQQLLRPSGSDDFVM